MVKRDLTRESGRIPIIQPDKLGKNKTPPPGRKRRPPRKKESPPPPARDLDPVLRFISVASEHHEEITGTGLLEQVIMELRRDTELDVSTLRKLRAVDGILAANDLRTASKQLLARLLVKARNISQTLGLPEDQGFHDLIRGIIKDTPIEETETKAGTSKKKAAIKKTDTHAKKSMASKMEGASSDVDDEHFETGLEEILRLLGVKAKAGTSSQEMHATASKYKGFELSALRMHRANLTGPIELALDTFVKYLSDQMLKGKSIYEAKIPELPGYDIWQVVIDAYKALTLSRINSIASGIIEGITAIDEAIDILVKSKCCDRQAALALFEKIDKEGKINDGEGRKNLETLCAELERIGFGVFRAPLYEADNKTRRDCVTVLTLGSLLEQYKNIVADDGEGLETFLTRIKEGHKDVKELLERRISKTGDNALNYDGNEEPLDLVTAVHDLKEELKRHHAAKAAKRIA